MSAILFVSVLIFLNSQAFAQAAGQFKLYAEQYGRFSIQVPKDWTASSPSIKQDSDSISFDPNNNDDISVIISASDRHSAGTEADSEQAIREQNTYTVQNLPGATLIQDTECTKYVIDGNQACSVIYSVTKDQYTQKEMDIDFQTGKQVVSISVSGSDFDKYLPTAIQMLNSMKVS